MISTAAPPKFKPLSNADQKLLKELEVDLQNDGQASLATAKALCIIDGKRLYRGHANSMKGYGLLWGYSSSYTYRLIQCGIIYYRLEPLWRDDGLAAPTSAWQLRPLWKLVDAAAQKAAWKEAVNRSKGETPTAVMVEECVLAQSGTPPVPPVARKAGLSIDLDQLSGLAEFIDEEAERQGMTPQVLILAVLADFYEKRTATIDDVVASVYEDLSLCGIYRA